MMVLDRKKDTSGMPLVTSCEHGPRKFKKAVEIRKKVGDFRQRVGYILSIHYNFANDQVKNRNKQSLTTVEQIKWLMKTFYENMFDSTYLLVDYKNANFLRRLRRRMVEKYNTPL
jgi:hypothetical protein